jgi:hypothetical protein
MKKDDLYILQNRSFDIVILISWILYILIALNISVHAPDYLDDLEFYIKIYISLFLLYRFMPFRKIKFTDLDRKIAFNAGIFIFTATAIGSILKNYLKQVHDLFIKTL